jgi:hypothetical protein
MPIIPAWKQEDLEFETSLSYTVRPYLKKKKDPQNKKKKQTKIKLKEVCV